MRVLGIALIGSGVRVREHAATQVNGGQVIFFFIQVLT